ncbi:MAG: hypothetical protein EHM26_07250 [Desulfobacteraceae bacterium]|nr:MAG: hypothetical protein EHM26_07250 [Desulfobacteraceae bacterium]
MANDKQYWFPAKRYGWGWGLPSSWQGWIALFIFIATVALGFYVFPPDKQLGLFLVYVGVLTVLLVAICWLKGEPPRWRWGGDGST